MVETPHHPKIKKSLIFQVLCQEVPRKLVIALPKAAGHDDIYLVATYWMLSPSSDYVCHASLECVPGTHFLDTQYFHNPGKYSDDTHHLELCITFTFVALI